MVADLEARVERLEALLNQMIRTGVVESVQEDTGKIRVRFPDTDDLVSMEIPVLFGRTADNQHYDMPDEGEQWVCLFLPNGPEQGYALGTLYSESDPVPVRDRNTRYYRFKDSTFESYDRENHVMTLDVKGRLDIRCDEEITIHSDTHLKLTAPRIDLNPNEE